MPPATRLARAALATGLVVLAAASAVAAADPGPPFPDPEFNRAVYDTAGVFSQATIASVETTIDEILAPQAE